MEKLLSDEKTPGAAMQIVQDCLVISVQIELYKETLEQLRRDLLDQIKLSGVRKAIFDLSTVDLLDAYAYNSICATANMARVMGTQTLLSGIQPGVASALVELGVDVGQIETTLNLEDGIAKLAELSLHADALVEELPLYEINKMILQEITVEQNIKSQGFFDGDAGMLITDGADSEREQGNE